MEIKSLSDIYLIAQQRPDKVVFQIPELDATKNEAWEKRFNDLLNECGCSSGRQFIMYAAPVHIIALVVLVAFTGLSKVVILALFGGAILLTGITGKVAGLVQRNRKITKLINEVVMDFQPD